MAVVMFIRDEHHNCQSYDGIIPERLIRRGVGRVWLAAKSLLMGTTIWVLPRELYVEV